jgi:LacI family repressor for deo operon, udp, cdd, tsx, nupC, and nupG
MLRSGRAASRKDVAAAAGVAPSTVSLIINQTPGIRIPTTTRDRVLEAARRLGYRSSTIARSLVTGKTGTVGAVMHFVDHPFHNYTAGVLEGFWSAVQPHGYRILLSNGTPDACIAGLFRERCVDGLLVVAAPTGSDDRELHDLAAAGFPVVFVGSLPLAIAANYLDIDNVAVGRSATERLLSLGHRRILHLAGPLDVNTSALDRLAG